VAIARTRFVLRKRSQTKPNRQPRAGRSPRATGRIACPFGDGARMKIRRSNGRPSPPYASVSTLGRCGVSLRRFVASPPRRFRTSPLDSVRGSERRAVRDAARLASAYGPPPLPHGRGRGYTRRRQLLALAKRSATSGQLTMFQNALM
jgi:hypothetical protein